MSGAELARRGGEILASDGTAVCGIAGALQKSHTGAPVFMRDLFLPPAVFSAPASYINVVTTRIAFGIEAAGLFIFGANVRYQIDAAPTFEDWSYVLGFDGAEIVQLAYSPNPGFPFYRPVEVDRDGRVFFTAENAADSSYVWCARVSARTALANCGRRNGHR